MGYTSEFWLITITHHFIIITLPLLTLFVSYYCFQNHVLVQIGVHTTEKEKNAVMETKNQTLADSHKLYNDDIAFIT